jgi:hypothetical protein
MDTRQGFRIGSIRAFFGAEAEEREVLARAALGELTVEELIAPQAPSVSASDLVFDAGERMVAEKRPASGGGAAA